MESSGNILNFRNFFYQQWSNGGSNIWEMKALCAVSIIPVSVNPVNDLTVPVKSVIAQFVLRPGSYKDHTYKAKNQTEEVNCTDERVSLYISYYGQKELFHNLIPG